MFAYDIYTTWSGKYYIPQYWIMFHDIDLHFGHIAIALIDRRNRGVLRLRW